MMALGLFLGLAGCATPMPVDFGSAPNLQRVSGAAIRSVEIVNRAEVPTYRAPGFAEVREQPMDRFLRPMFKDLLEADLRACLSANGKQGPSLRISILEARLNSQTRAADTVPFVGMASSFLQKDLEARVRLVIEVVENGKVTKTWQVEHRTVNRGLLTNHADLVRSSQALVSKFRGEFFPRVQTEFVDRYL